MRLINITTDESHVRVKLISARLPTAWKLIAQDGADLPAARQQIVVADTGRINPRYRNPL